MHTLSDREWRIVRSNRARGLERFRHDEETSIAAAIQEALPQLSRSEALREARRIFDGRN